MSMPSGNDDAAKSMVAGILEFLSNLAAFALDRAVFGR